MALRTFWAEVAVRNPLFKGGLSQPDPPRITQQELDAALSKTNEWQFVGPIRGFDETDFDFLPEAKRQELAEQVQEFNELAPKLRAMVNRPLSNEGAIEEMQVANEARPLLRNIILLLEQDRHADPEAFAIGKKIEQRLNPWPPQLDNLRFESGLDHSGFPALWVWAFVRGSVERDEGAFFAAVDHVHPILEEAAREVAPDRWPYISFRSALVQTEAEAAA